MPTPPFYGGLSAERYRRRSTVTAALVSVHEPAQDAVELLSRPAVGAHLPQPAETLAGNTQD